MIKAIIGFIIGLLIGFILFAVTPLGNRYYFMEVNDDTLSLYRVDTWTGKAWWCVVDADKELKGCAEITKEEYELNFK